MVAVLQRAAAEQRRQLWPAGPAPAWARARVEAAMACRLSEDRLACELSLALLAASCSSYRRDTVADPLPFPGSDRVAPLRDVLLSLPPLKAIARDPSVLRRLDVAALATLCAALFASPVRFRTLRAPGAPAAAADGTGAAGAWAEVGVSGRCPDWGFAALKAQHGVLTGYHGSAAENFHRICHTGLENRSGSKGEKNGALFGAGVYLATACAVARGFAARTGERPRVHRRSAFAPNQVGTLGAAWPEFPFEVVARCQVINLPANVAPRVVGSSDSSSEAHDYLVVQDQHHVQLHSLLLFPTDAALLARPPPTRAPTATRQPAWRLPFTREPAWVLALAAVVVATSVLCLWGHLIFSSS
jgi:hypothetical protein